LPILVSQIGVLNSSNDDLLLTSAMENRCISVNNGRSVAKNTLGSGDPSHIWYRSEIK
jgi:hypothetical protein